VSVSGGVVAVPLSIVVVGDGLLEEIWRHEAGDGDVAVGFVWIVVVVVVVVV
jgi:hypothetical protein